MTKNIVILIFVFFIYGCSFDNKSGIWKNGNLDIYKYLMINEASWYIYMILLNKLVVDIDHFIINKCKIILSSNDSLKLQFKKEKIEKTTNKETVL